MIEKKKNTSSTTRCTSKIKHEEKKRVPRPLLPLFRARAEPGRERTIEGLGKRTHHFHTSRSSAVFHPHGYNAFAFRHLSRLKCLCRIFSDTSSIMTNTSYCTQPHGFSSRKNKKKKAGKCESITRQNTASHTECSVHRIAEICCRNSSTTVRPHLAHQDQACAAFRARTACKLMA